MEISRTGYFDKWLASLRDGKAKIKIMRGIEKDRAGKFRKPQVEGQVWETRIDYGPGYRLYYAKKVKRFICFCAEATSLHTKRIFGSLLYLPENFLDTYSKWTAAKLYTTKLPITGANLLNDRVLPFFADEQMGRIRILRVRGTEYCGKLETHDYLLYLGIIVLSIHAPKRDIRRQMASTNTSTNILYEFYHITLLRKLYHPLEERQAALLEHYNTERPHQGKNVLRQNPMKTLPGGKKP